MGVGGSSNVPRNIDLNVARRVAVAMSHAADCLPTPGKVEDTFLPFSQLAAKNCVALHVAKRELRPIYFCDLSRYVAGFRECCLCISQTSRSTEAPPGTIAKLARAYNNFDRCNPG